MGESSEDTVDQGRPERWGSRHEFDKSMYLCMRSGITSGTLLLVEPINKIETYH